MNVTTVVRIVAGLVSPIVVALAALALDQTGLFEIPWIGGAILVVVVAGLVCGLLLRTPLASAYIFAIWLVWAVVALATDDGHSDPPVEAAVLGMLPLLALPAAFAAFVGGVISSAWTERSRTRQNRSV